MLSENNPYSIKGRFIIQEVQEKRSEKNSRHESISIMSKKVFMKTHYKSKPKFTLSPNGSDYDHNNKSNYSSLVYDHHLDQWVDFDSIWNHHHGIKNETEYSFSKIFHYLFGDTEKDLSDLHSNNEDHTTKSSKDIDKDKGMIKDNNIKKPKSQNYLPNNQITIVTPLVNLNKQNIKENGFAIQSTDFIHYEGEVSEEKKIKRREKLFISNAISIQIGRIQ